MVIRTSRAGEPSFTLGTDIMKENDDFQPYHLFRSDLREALENKAARVTYWFTPSGIGLTNAAGGIKHGTTQRGKKFIQIGCKRFVGANRLKLIRWAKGKP